MKAAFRRLIVKADELLARYIDKRVCEESSPDV